MFSLSTAPMYLFFLGHQIVGVNSERDEFDFSPDGLNDFVERSTLFVEQLDLEIYSGWTTLSDAGIFPENKRAILCGVTGSKGSASVQFSDSCLLP